MASLATPLRLSCPRRLLSPPTHISSPPPWSPSTQSLRSFTTSLRLRAATSKPPMPPPPPSRYAYVKSLASKQTPTLLYESPSHAWFYFGCWSSGLSIISWTVLTGPTVISQPDGIPQWVGLVFAASYALLGSMGFYIVSKTPNIVSSIRILPRAQQHATGPGAAAAAAAQPQIEVTVKRMLPLLQPKVITTDLDKVALKTRFSLPSEFVPELERLERQQREEAARQALGRFDMDHLLTMPFRRIGRAVVAFFRGVRAAWTGMGYGIIRVDGKEYKVDVTKGYAHDGFHTLERIVKIGE